MVVDRNFAAFAASRIVLFRTGRAMALAVSHIGRLTAARNDFPTSGTHAMAAGSWRTGLRETAATNMAAAAGGVDSNKGVSESLSALEGKKY